jgi:pyruvate/2-oxoglutarate dehydrogenase complex dihydrolipoamide dehydrogenase (E3) component
VVFDVEPKEECTSGGWETKSQSISHAVRALRASSRVLRQVSHSRQFGIEADQIRSSLMNWMKAQRAATSRLAEELRNGLRAMNVRIVSGAGSLLSEHQVRITDSCGKREEVEAEHIILATGSHPDFPSSLNSRFFNSDDLIARVLSPSSLVYYWRRLCRVRI